LITHIIFKDCTGSTLARLDLTDVDVDVAGRAALVQYIEARLPETLVDAPAGSGK
jgi:hypothetical protein